MRKILSLLVVSLFVCGLAFADTDYDSDNVMILGPNMGVDGITPPVMIVKVTLNSDDAGAKGDVLTWDVTSARNSDGDGLGYSVRRCDINSLSGDTADSDQGAFTDFAGVLVTTTASDDLTDSRTSVRARGGEVGYMAVKGYCDAKLFVGDNDLWRPIIGRPLTMMGNHLAGSFGTMRATVGVYQRMSRDIGILLEAPGTTSAVLRKVWLY